MKLKVTQTALPEVILLEPVVRTDERGFFMETFNREHFAQAIGRQVEFVQDNQSNSTRNVVRGMHYQRGSPQGKLVRALTGEIFDVAVDMRRSSPNFGRWTAAVLSATNRLQMWIPEGFAHGFLVQSDSADVLYKTTEFWRPDCECTVFWADPDIGITWPLAGVPVLSGKDRNALGLCDAPAFS